MDDIPCWRLLRGEQFIFSTGVHPKAFELYDRMVEANQLSTYASQIDSSQTHLTEQEFTFIKGIIKEYPSARQFFIEKLAMAIRQAAADNRQSRVVFRTTDLKGYEIKSLVGTPYFEDMSDFQCVGQYPQFRLRGLSRYIRQEYVDLFKWELEACRLASSHGDIKLSIVFPFVRTPSELKQALDIMKKLKIEPEYTGMMVEVPSNIYLIDDFLSLLPKYRFWHGSKSMLIFGLTDLTQTTGMVARDNPEVIKGVEVKDPGQHLGEHIDLFDETAPSLLKGVKHVISRAQKKRVECGLPNKDIKAIVRTDISASSMIITNISFITEDYFYVPD